MIKLSLCLRRLPHLSREDFQTYWREQHAPLVARHAKTLGILRYVQVHTGHDALNAGMQSSRGGPEAYDGVAELWFESEAAMAANTSEAAAKAGAELLEDEKKFIDLENSPLWFGDEHVVVG
ncbi:MAG: EthD domain-containing protein [Alphaproteobacteria bacterium]|nr:EthD domain-containing protein [Alphaproteobacteria bacterium]